MVEPALEREVSGVTWWSVPPPGPGAILLRVLPVALGGGGPADLLDACLAASDARDRLLGDPHTGPVDVDALMQGTSRGTGTASMSADDSGDTAAVVAADSEGRTVTLIQSVYQSFGSGILDPMTGIVLHNRGSAFSTDPRSPARVAPGRPPHTLCPTIAATSAGVVALGCQGAVLSRGSSPNWPAMPSTETPGRSSSSPGVGG